MCRRTRKTEMKYDNETVLLAAIFQKANPLKPPARVIHPGRFRSRKTGSCKKEFAGDLCEHSAHGYAQENENEEK